MDKLRRLDLETLQQRSSKYLSTGQIDALEARRKLIVKHFEEEISKRGHVLYGLRT